MAPKCALRSLVYQFGGLAVSLRWLFLSSVWFPRVSTSAPKGMFFKAKNYGELPIVLPTRIHLVYDRVLEGVLVSTW